MEEAPGEDPLHGRAGFPAAAEAEQEFLLDREGVLGGVSEALCHALEGEDGSGWEVEDDVFDELLGSEDGVAGGGGGGGFCGGGSCGGGVLEWSALGVMLAGCGGEMFCLVEGMGLDLRYLED